MTFTNATDQVVALTKAEQPTQRAMVVAALNRVYKAIVAEDKGFEFQRSKEILLTVDSYIELSTDVYILDVLKVEFIAFNTGVSWELADERGRVPPAYVEGKARSYRKTFKNSSETSPPQYLAAPLLSGITLRGGGWEPNEDKIQVLYVASPADLAAEDVIPPRLESRLVDLATVDILIYYNRTEQAMAIMKKYSQTTSTQSQQQS